MLEEFNNNIKGKKVAILGLGVSNKPLVKYLYDLSCDIDIYNEKELEYDNPYNLNIYTGKGCMDNLEGYDYIFRSPSILPTRSSLIKAKESGTIITSEIEEVIKLTPSKVIGVTGSDGKTTTTTLINEVLKKCGYKTFLGGNIGYPLFTSIKDMKKEDIVVLELSSFQLMGMEVSPDISIITNISENHLDIHKDFNEYITSKQNIYKYQDKTGILVVNSDNDITNKFITNGITRHFSGHKKITDGFYTLEDTIYDKEGNIFLQKEDIKLRGHHNYENIAAMLTAISDLVDINKAKEVIKSFGGVEHRLELVRTINGIKWYNDSVSSSPTRTIAGLYSYDENIVLIAGGYDKNISYEPIAKPIVEKVRVLILIGNTTDKIYNAVSNELKKEGRDMPIYKCNSLKEAVDTAYKHSTHGDVVLFSPASASFDMFKNFADRGIKFKDLVNNLPE